MQIHDDLYPLDEIRRFCRAQPYEPFVIKVAGGREVHVQSPEYIAFHDLNVRVAVHQADERLDLIGRDQIKAVRLEVDDVEEAA